MSSVANFWHGWEAVDYLPFRTAIIVAGPVDRSPTDRALHCRGRSSVQRERRDVRNTNRTRTSAVSRNKSATRARCIWDSFCATSVNRTRAATSAPAHNSALRNRCSSPAAGNRSIHRMLFGTLARMRSQAAYMFLDVRQRIWCALEGYLTAYRVDLGPSHA